MFDSLYGFGKTFVLNNPKIKTNTINQESNVDALYYLTNEKSGVADSFAVNFAWINNYNVVVGGWFIKRLLLQVYLNYDHWLKIDKIIKKSGKGFYVINNLSTDNGIYFFDGSNYIENYSKKVWPLYFPAQFVRPDSPKPDNKYPRLPALPDGAKFEDN